MVACWGIRILSCPDIWKSGLPQNFLHKFSTRLTVVLANEKNIFCSKICLECKLKMFKEYHSLIFTFTCSRLWVHKLAVYLSLSLCCLYVGYVVQAGCLRSPLPMGRSRRRRPGQGVRSDTPNRVLGGAIDYGRSFRNQLRSTSRWVKSGEMYTVFSKQEMWLEAFLSDLQEKMR